MGQMATGILYGCVAPKLRETEKNPEGFYIPGLRLLVDGNAPLLLDASRADQLRCGGNGVVALQAACAFVGLVRRAGLA